jgi:hypothetical protein
VKLTAPRLAWGAAASLVALVATGTPAVAVHVPDPPTANFASPIPTATPIYNLAQPPASVLLPASADACSDDGFLSYRSIDTPVRQTVTVCGTIVAVPASGTTHPGTFALDVDGTELISVVYDGATPGSFAAGQVAVVRGVYHRASHSAEWIDQTRAAAALLPGYVLIGTTTYQ